MARSFLDRILPEPALTFADVAIVPGIALPEQTPIDLSTSLCADIPLRLPFLLESTDPAQSIAMAQMGGIAIAADDSHAKQIQHVRAVKKYQARIVRRPLTVGPETSLAEVLDLQARHGVASFPVIDPANNHLVGIITRRDSLKSDDPEAPVSTLMTPAPLATWPDGGSLEQAAEQMRQHQIEQLIVVNPQGQCVGLVTAKDYERQKASTAASLDEQGRLRVIARIAPGPKEYDHISILLEEGVDVLLVEAPSAYSKAVLDTVTYIRRQRDFAAQVIAGNALTVDAAMALADAGAAAVMVGVPRDTAAHTAIAWPCFSVLGQIAENCQARQVAVIAHYPWTDPANKIKALAAGCNSIISKNIFENKELKDIIHAELENIYQSMRMIGSGDLKALQSLTRFIRKTK